MKETIKLYRGFKKRPKLPIDKLAKEKEDLEEELKKVQEAMGKDGTNPSNLTEILKRWEGKNLVRLADLRKLAEPQFFTEDKENAEHFAGREGFVWKIEVPREVAEAHITGEELMGKSKAPQTNYVFEAEELLAHDKEWGMDVIEMERETERKESKLSRTIMDGEKPKGLDGLREALKSHFPRKK